jgi:RNA polymerase sigma factor (sigma-70 family)
MEDAAKFFLNAAGRISLLTPAEELHLGGLVRAWQDHPGGPDLAPPAVVRRGRRARDRMVEANLKLVAHVAERMAFRGQQRGELADRLQEGAKGLVRAAEKFDPARGYKFSTYAYWWIRQGINNWNLADSTIRVPLNVAAALRGQQNGDVSPEQLAAGRAASLVHSLDQPVPGCEETSSLANVLPSPAPPEDDPIVHELRARLAALPPLQARLVRGRWGIGCAAQRIGVLAAAEGISSHAASAQLRLGEAALREAVDGSAPMAPPPPPEPWRSVVCCQLSLSLTALNP